MIGKEKEKLEQDEWEQECPVWEVRGSREQVPIGSPPSRNQTRKLRWLELCPVANFSPPQRLGKQRTSEVSLGNQGHFIVHFFQ